MKHPYRSVCPKCGATVESDIPYISATCSHGRPVSRHNPAVVMVEQFGKSKPSSDPAWDVTL